MFFLKRPLFLNQNGNVLFLLRLVVTFIFLWHGLPKAIDPAAAAVKFESMGFPGFLGGIVGWMEVICGLMLLLGVFTTIISGILGIIILVALVGVQLPKGIVAGFERDLLIFVTLLILFTHGPGNWAIDNFYSKK